MIILPILTASLVHLFLKVWENAFFELGSERRFVCVQAVATAFPCKRKVVSPDQLMKRAYQKGLLETVSHLTNERSGRIVV